MDEMQWLRESWLDTLALTSDWMNSRDYQEDMKMAVISETSRVLYYEVSGDEFAAFTKAAKVLFGEHLQVSIGGTFTEKGTRELVFANVGTIPVDTSLLFRPRDLTVKVDGEWIKINRPEMIDQLLIEKGA